MPQTYCLWHDTPASQQMDKDTSSTKDHHRNLFIYFTLFKLQLDVRLLNMAHEITIIHTVIIIYIVPNNMLNLYTHTQAIYIKQIMPKKN